MELLFNYIVALTNLYGIVHKRKVLEIYNLQNEDQIGIDTVEKLMEDHPDKLRSQFVYIHDDYFEQEAIKNAAEFNEELRKKQGKPYYIPEKRELLKYTDDFYFEKTKEYSALLRYLTKHIYQGNKLHASNHCEDIQGLLQVEGSINRILEDFPPFDKEEQVSEVLDLVTNLSNNTRLWSNNGHTPQELAAYEQPFLGKFPVDYEGSHEKPDLTVIDGGTNKKIGRNEPCPCGSGKKYKKCCLNKG